MNMLYPVVGAREGSFGAVAVFFTLSDAARFCTTNDRHIGTPQYDRREKGYRYEPPQVGQTYAEWCAEQDARIVAEEADGGPDPLISLEPGRRAA